MADTAHPGSRFLRALLIPLALTIVFLALKLAILLCSIDKFADDDELHIGATARELSRGPVLGFLDLKNDQWTNGVLVMAPLVVPLFLAFGQSFLTLKLLALLFAWGTMLAWYLVCQKLFSRRAAVLTALLLIFSPPLFTKISLQTLGNHAESCLFTVVILFAAYRTFGRREAWRYLALGAACGFATWFCYTLLVTVATCLALWFVVDRLFFTRRRFLLFVAAFCLGYSLWLVEGIAHDFEAANIYGKPVFAHFTNLLALPQHIWSFVVRDLRDSFFFEELGGLSAGLVGSAFYLGVVICWIALLWLERTALLAVLRRVTRRTPPQDNGAALPPIAIVVAFPLLYGLIFCLSDFRPGARALGFGEYRFFLPLYPFLFCGVALCVSKLSERTRPRGVRLAASLLFLIILTIGAGSSLKLAPRARLGRSLIYDGVDYDGLGQLCGWRYAGDMAKCLAVIEKLDPPHRPNFCRGLGYLAGRDPKWTPQNWLPRGYETFTAVGIGRGSFSADPVYSVATLDKLRQIADSLPPGCRRSFYLGVGLEMGRHLVPDGLPELLDLFEGYLAQEYLGSCRVGVGWGIAEQQWFDAQACQGIYRWTDPSRVADLWDGFAIGAAWKFRDPRSIEYVKAEVPEWCRSRFQSRVDGVRLWREDGSVGATQGR